MFDHKKMFVPDQYIVNNPQLYGVLSEYRPDAGNAVLFYLMTDNSTFNSDFDGYINNGAIPEAERQKLVMGFPYIPSQISFSYATEYGITKRAMALTEDLQFLGNSAERVTISDVILSTRSEGRSFLPLLQKLKFLMSNQTTPSFFYIGIQDRILYPYVLNNMNIVEKGWQNGLPVEGTVSFEFIKSAWGNSGVNTNNAVGSGSYTELDEVLSELRTTDEAINQRVIQSNPPTTQDTLDPSILPIPPLPIPRSEGPLPAPPPIPTKLTSKIELPNSFIGNKTSIINSQIIANRNAYNEIFR